MLVYRLFHRVLVSRYISVPTFYIVDSGAHKYLMVASLNFLKIFYEFLLMFIC